jgi:hypothetical protein
VSGRRLIASPRPPRHRLLRRHRHPRPGGRLPDGRLSDGTGRIYDRVEDAVGAERATGLLAAGAAVVWDDCGCGGYCGLDWVEGERLDRLRRSGPPSIRRVGPKRGQSGWIEEWHAADGAMLLYVAGDVRWGKADRGQP